MSRAMAMHVDLLYFSCHKVKFADVANLPVKLQQFRVIRDHLTQNA